MIEFVKVIHVLVLVIVLLLPHLLFSLFFRWDTNRFGVSFLTYFLDMTVSICLCFLITHRILGEFPTKFMVETFTLAIDDGNSSISFSLCGIKATLFMYCEWIDRVAFCTRWWILMVRTIKGVWLLRSIPERSGPNRYDSCAAVNESPVLCLTFQLTVDVSLLVRVFFAIRYR